MEEGLLIHLYVFQTGGSEVICPRVHGLGLKGVLCLTVARRSCLYESHFVALAACVIYFLLMVVAFHR